MWYTFSIHNHAIIDGTLYTISEAVNFLNWKSKMATIFKKADKSTRLKMMFCLGIFEIVQFAWSTCGFLCFYRRYIQSSSITMRSCLKDALEKNVKHVFKTPVLIMRKKLSCHCLLVDCAIVVLLNFHEDSFHKHSKKQNPWWTSDYYKISTDAKYSM